MNNMDKEQMKIGLLGLIAVVMILNTYFLATSGNEYRPKKELSSNRLDNNDQRSGNNTSNNTGNINKKNATFSSEPRKKKSNNRNQKSNEPKRAITKIDFNEYKHDFGKIKQKTENVHNFKFTNSGDEPLVIQDAKGSCGCTVPKYPKKPIQPGESEKIKVKYSPGKQKGQQRKRVTVTANTEPRQTKLSITANVQEVK